MCCSLRGELCLGHTGEACLQRVVLYLCLWPVAYLHSHCSSYVVAARSIVASIAFTVCKKTAVVYCGYGFCSRQQRRQSLTADSKGHRSVAVQSAQLSLSTAASALWVVCSGRPHQCSTPAYRHCLPWLACLCDAAATLTPTQDSTQHLRPGRVST